MSRKKINLVLMITWMIVIFAFSQQPGNMSNENNRFVVDIFKKINIDLNEQLGNMCDFVIRKLAHFTEYFLLYILSFRVLQDRRKNYKLNYIYALLIVFLYACTDEFHQLFILGREGKFRDVIIDTAGGTLAMMILYLKVSLKKLK
ncbi:VanZ family protein [Clostridium oryzae]|uniref:VanZ like family protein n=1 Tax=Clostridium oryzae TaxID=1450648 RepID=A0A1V4I9T8_9CLOT|nr:VanZ family protein [Clostridium oryzae]OPJ56683.1 VanZ like family protein [Clostridium oryzae]